MKKLLICLFGIFVLIVGSSCSDDLPNLNNKDEVISLERYQNKIVIDSAYTYIGDSIYNSWLNIYNSTIGDEKKARTLSPEDDAFFNRTYVVKSSEATLLYGRNYIFPGAILEANSISTQKYSPISVSNRNPITVSMTLTHQKPKHTSREISSPSYSKLSDYVKDMAHGGNFQQNEKFMFQNKRFTYYDEIKSAFGTNVDTRKLFSSKKVNSTENSEHILKSSGMYVKFYQSSFTVNMDIAPLSSQLIKGKTNEEPVFVSSVTYGRLGVLVFETDKSYDFAEKCIKKEFSRIFSKKTTTLTEEEKRFFENTEFKVLIIGADSDYTVQTVNGYAAFLNLIYNSRFTETSFGVPISCTFSYANTLGLVETEFVNHLQIEPLFVEYARDNYSYSEKMDGSYSWRYNANLYFYSDRQKKKTANPSIDVIFNVHKSSFESITDPRGEKSQSNDENIKMRNIAHKSKLELGVCYETYESFGLPRPSEDERRVGLPMLSHWTIIHRGGSVAISHSPFYIIID